MKDSLDIKKQQKNRNLFGGNLMGMAGGMAGGGGGGSTNVVVAPS